MQAFQIALRERNFQILDLLISLTQMMVEGGCCNSSGIGKIDISEAIAWSWWTQDRVSLQRVRPFGSHQRRGRHHQQEQLAEYAWNLGMGVPACDDVLDFTAREDAGKPVGGDLREGKVTLPLVYALERATPPSANWWRRFCAIALRRGAFRAHSIAAGKASRHRARARPGSGVHGEGARNHRRLCESPYQRALWRSLSS